MYGKETAPQKHVNRFEGMSTLRAKEKEVQPKSEQAKALEKYLLKYGDANQAGKEGKPKKRKRPQPAPQSLRMVDMDTTGFAMHPVAEKAAKKKMDLEAYMAEGDEDGDDKDDAPVVANMAEAEHLARLAAKEKSGAALQNWQEADLQDQAPLRSDNQASGSRRQRHDSPDNTPPRRQRHDSPDNSPPRRQRHDDPESPPRKQRHDSPDNSPPRRQRHDSPDDSPPRRQRQESSDESPPRRKSAAQSDLSPPRRRNSAADESPPRRPRLDDSAQIPGRAGKGLPAGALRAEGTKIMSDGTTAGMVSGKRLVAEMAQRREEEKKRFAKLEAASGAKHAETVFRNAQTGARMSKEEFEAAAKKAADKKKAVYEAPEWGGGMRQAREREQQAKDIIAERSRPFAPTKDDVDQELNLRDRLRFGDPMSHLVKQREAAPPPPVIPERMAKQMKKSGFIVPQEVPGHSWLKRNLGPPPNRYGIRPGRHWDGVDRSTGFERDMFKTAASRAALEKEARAWAQADM